jgi:hypothetical protein
MSLFATAAFSAEFGQLVCGFLVEKGWRFIHWHQLIINGALMIAIAVVFEETRAPVLLSNRAKKLNDAPSSTSTPMGDVSGTRTHWKVKEDEERATIKQMLLTSVTRPFCEHEHIVLTSDGSALTSVLDLLVREPVVFWFSMWGSFSWAVIFLYMIRLQQGRIMLTRLL